MTETVQVKYKAMTRGDERVKVIRHRIAADEMPSFIAECDRGMKKEMKAYRLSVDARDGGRIVVGYAAVVHSSLTRLFWLDGEELLDVAFSKGLTVNRMNTLKDAVYLMRRIVLETDTRRAYRLNATIAHLDGLIDFYNPSSGLLLAQLRARVERLATIRGSRLYRISIEALDTTSGVYRVMRQYESDMSPVAIEDIRTQGVAHFGRRPANFAEVEVIANGNLMFSVSSRGVYNYN